LDKLKLLFNISIRGRKSCFSGLVYGEHYNNMKTKIYKSIIILFSILYGALVAFTFISPHTIEKEARVFITQKVSEKTHERIDAIGSSKIFKHKIFKKAKEKLKEKKSKLAMYKRLLHEKADEKLAAVMAKVQNLDCECREKHQKIFHAVLTGMVKSVGTAVKNIEKFMTQSYMKIMQKVLDDFKIFAGTNFVVSFILVLLLFFKPQENSSLNILSGMMILSTIICSYFYIFEQNWFFTLIFNDFVGFWYVLYLFLVFMFFVDIVFNKGRITDAILSSIGNAFSSVGNC